jgi:hypothetical protein
VTETSSLQKAKLCMKFSLFYSDERKPFSSRNTVYGKTLEAMENVIIRTYINKYV